MHRILWYGGHLLQYIVFTSADYCHRGGPGFTLRRGARTRLFPANSRESDRAHPREEHHGKNLEIFALVLAIGDSLGGLGSSLGRLARLVRKSIAQVHTAEAVGTYFGRLVRLADAQDLDLVLQEVVEF